MELLHKTFPPYVPKKGVPQAKVLDAEPRLQALGLDAHQPHRVASLDVLAITRN